MGLFLYRRHSEDCKVKNKGSRFINGCDCMVWVDGTVSPLPPLYQEWKRTGVRPESIPSWVTAIDDIYKSKLKRVRIQKHSLGTRILSEATDKLHRLEREYEIGHVPVKQPSPVDNTPTVAQAVNSYISECETRNLERSTIKCYRTALDPLADFYLTGSMSTITLENLTAFRAARVKDAPGSGAKELTTVRSFMKYAVQRKWLSENYATHLKAPQINRAPTMPFERDQVKAILAACDAMNDSVSSRVERTRLKAKGLCLIMLYTGLRISDAVSLQRSNVNLETGQVMLKMMKTNQPLYTQLPEEALIVLRALPVESPYFIWNGRCTLATAIRISRRTFQTVLRLAGVKGHPHMCRDTFAVEMLKQRVDIRTVSLLLGHANVQTTEASYAPWVTGMQDMLGDALAKLSFS